MASERGLAAHGYLPVPTRTRQKAGLGRQIKAFIHESPGLAGAPVPSRPQMTCNFPNAWFAWDSVKGRPSRPDPYKAGLRASAIGSQLRSATSGVLDDAAGINSAAALDAFGDPRPRI